MAAPRPSDRRLAASKDFVIPSTYEELLRDVRAVLFTGQVKIEYAWLMMFHDIGRLIHEHLLLRHDRAGYAAKTFSQLASDTGVSRRVLYEWVQFYRYFPIVRQSAQLTRTHYRLLCQVGDDKQRKTLTVQATKNKWTTPELGERVRALNAALSAASEANDGNGIIDLKPTPDLLTPKRGRPGVYRVVARDDALFIDVGFKLYLPLTPHQSRGRTAGQIIRVAEDGSTASDDEAKASDLFTYRVTIRRVIDGDTLAIGVALPHYTMDEKLRLRGIDCAEMDTPEGKAAKRFVEALLNDAVEITVVTSKVDKYDRYLADIHLRHRSGEEVFLNNALLERSHARLMAPSAETDWMP